MTPAPAPATEAEAHRETARLILGPSHLLAACRGDEDTARQDLSSSHHSLSAPGDCGYRVAVRGRHVEYAFASGPTGTVRVVDLLRLAVRSVTPAAAQRLADAWSARGDALHQRSGAPTQADADREVDDATAAWWDAAPAEQLELFAPET